MKITLVGKIYLAHRQQRFTGKVVGPDNAKWFHGVNVYDIIGLEQLSECGKITVEYIESNADFGQALEMFFEPISQ
jgi:hypothetical protein